MAGMREVAKKAGVSLSTVSAVLNRKKNVSPYITEKVERAIQEIGYTVPVKKEVNPKAIAVILPVITSAFFSNVLSSIEDTAAEKGYTLIFGSTGYSFEKEMQFINTIKKQELAGLIIDTVCPAEKNEKYLALLKTNFVFKRIPVVFLESFVNDDDFYRININNYENAYMATEHLIKQKHLKIAHLSGRPENQISAQRLQGYKSALEKYGVPFDPGLVAEGDFSPNSGYVAMKNLMIRRSDFTAVFTANDQMAIGAIKAIHSNGKSVPGDISVIGIDNIGISSIVTPALSTISVPTYQMGHRAARIIIDHAAGIKSHKVYALESNLIIRKSTDPNMSSEWDLFGW